MVEKKNIRLTPKLKAAALEYKEQLEQMMKDLNDVAKDVIPELEKNYNVECRAHSGRPDKISLYRGNISGSYQLYATGDDAEMNINDASSILVEELENELHKSKINATVNTKFPVTWADAAVYVSINVIPPSEDIYNAMVAIVDKEEDKRVKELRKRSRYSWGYDESTRWIRLSESSSNFKIGDKFVDDTHENFGKIYTITSLGVDSYDLEDVNGTQVTRDANYIGTNMHMASKEEIEKTQFAPTMESRMDEGLVDFLKGAGSGVRKVVSGDLNAGDTFTILSSSGREFDGEISNMDDNGRYCVSVTKDGKIVNPFKPCELLTIVTNDGDVLKARSLSYDRDSKCCIINTINKNDIRTHESKKK